MTNNNQKECSCCKEGKYHPKTSCAKMCFVEGGHRFGCTSQPSSVPVEEYSNQPNEKWEKCPACTSKNLRNVSKNKSECFTCGIKFNTSPSTPEVSWEERFDEEFSGYTRETYGRPEFINGVEMDTIGHEGVEPIRDFIKNVEQKAYEKEYIRGRHEEYGVTEIKIEKATLTERKRVNDILDGMKKEGDDFQCFNTDCFGNRTPTVIEKRLSSQDESYNLALEQAKHLINNTQ